MMTLGHLGQLSVTVLIKKEGNRKSETERDEVPRCCLENGKGWDCNRQILL